MLTEGVLRSPLTGSGTPGRGGTRHQQRDQRRRSANYHDTVVRVASERARPGCPTTAVDPCRIGTPALVGQAGLLSSTWDPGRDESSTCTVGRSPVVTLPTTVQPVEPSAINTDRVKFGPENVF